MQNAICYINKTIPVPRIVAIDEIDNVLGGEARTAGGRLRVDVIATKRRWQIECRKLTYLEFAAIRDYLRDIMYTTTYFWLDEFGGTPETHSIPARIRILEASRVQFGREGTWHHNGRDLTLEVEEQ